MHLTVRNCSLNPFEASSLRLVAPVFQQIGNVIQNRVSHRQVRFLQHIAAHPLSGGCGDTAAAQCCSAAAAGGHGGGAHANASEPGAKAVRSAHAADQLARLVAADVRKLVRIMMEVVHAFHERALHACDAQKFLSSNFI